MTPNLKVVIYNWTKEHWFKAGIFASLLLLSSSLAYYFLIYIPRQDASQKETVAFQSAMLDACLADAFQDYHSNWANTCERFGVSDQGPHCTLPKSNADTVERWHREERQDCFKKYSNK